MWPRFVCINSPTSYGSMFIKRGDVLVAGPGGRWQQKRGGNQFGASKMASAPSRISSDIAFAFTLKLVMIRLTTEQSFSNNFMILISIFMSEANTRNFSESQDIAYKFLDPLCLYQYYLNSAAEMGSKAKSLIVFQNLRTESCYQCNIRC